MRLVQVLVDAWMMQPSVNPVDEKVREKEEQGELDDVVPHARTFFSGVINLAVASNLKPERCCSEDCHPWQRLQRLPYLHANLVLEVFRVLECLVIKNEVI